MTTMPSPADPADLSVSTAPGARDYSLTGPSSRRAIALGLAAAEWYHSEVPRKVMKELMQRSDAPALRDTAIWVGLHVLFAAGGILSWGSWWAVPFWLAYGVMYGSACDARWHEHGHGTAFRTRWMNDVVYHIASFQVMRNPVSWRWSHARHHTDTIIVGRDAEIAWMLPPSLFKKAMHFLGVIDAWESLKTLGRNALGRLSDDEKDYIPDSERSKAVLAARIHMAIYALTLLATVWMLTAGLGWRAAIPFLLIGGPRVYGCWHFIATGLLQHGGLAEDVLDHRLNSRTVYLNRVSRFIYMNMNYHVEHHMFPMVPYYNLPKLHALIKHDLPRPNTGFLDAWREVIPAVLRQRRDPTYYLKRELPPTARPYREELHAIVPDRASA